MTIPQTANMFRPWQNISIDDRRVNVKAVRPKLDFGHFGQALIQNIGSEATYSSALSSGMVVMPNGLMRPSVGRSTTAERPS